MTKKELKLILKVLKNIKNPDTYCMEAIYNVERDILRYERRKGQLKEMADSYEYPWYGQ